MGVLPLGTHKMGAVFDNRDAAERNCEWVNATAEARATMDMSPQDVAEVLELHSIVNAVGEVWQPLEPRPPSGVDTSRPDDHGLLS